MKVKLGWCIIQFHWIITAATSSTSIIPSYVWPLAYIYNKTIPVTPPLSVHGNVTKAAMGLFLDGKNSWIDAGDFTGNCVAETRFCPNGLSLAVRIKFDASVDSFVLDSQPKFIFDSGGYTGEGVSLYTQNGQLVGVVEARKKIWTVSSPVISQKWHFVLLTWSEDNGLFMYIDGPKKSQSLQSSAIQQVSAATSNHVTIGRCNVESKETFGRFYIDMVAIFESFSPSGQVYLSYAYSPPTSKGNIRYVNARFINVADFNLVIFPDRGEHQEKGYQLEADSSTLLEYVLREGPIPSGMYFRIKNKANGEELKYENKDSIHITSSDDNQVVTELRIQPGGVISKVTSSLGVKADYQIAKASKTETEQPAFSPVSSKPEAAVQSVSLTNPELPIEEEANTTANATSTSSTNNAGNETNKVTSRPIPSPTVRVPTIPPPPVLPPVVYNTAANATKQNNGSAITVTSPELPTEEQQLAGVSVNVGNKTQSIVGNAAQSIVGNGTLVMMTNATQTKENQTTVESGNITVAVGVNETQTGSGGKVQSSGGNVTQGNTTSPSELNGNYSTTNNVTRPAEGVSQQQINTTSPNHTNANVTSPEVTPSNQTSNKTKEEKMETVALGSPASSQNIPPSQPMANAVQKQPNPWTQGQYIPERYDWDKGNGLALAQNQYPYQQGFQQGPWNRVRYAAPPPRLWGQGQYAPQQGAWNQGQYASHQPGVKQGQANDKLDKEYVDKNLQYTPLQSRSGIVNNQRSWQDYRQVNPINSPSYTIKFRRNMTRSLA